MRITVALRVIGGFSVISLLLIILGLSSIKSVSNIGSASEELSTLALPTVAGSSDLKASFLNMGRLTFEGFISSSKQTVLSKADAYTEARRSFQQNIDDLRSVVEKQANLREAVDKVQAIYKDYDTSTTQMFTSHVESIDVGMRLTNMLAQLEENVDDASSLLLDFNDLDEINNSKDLLAVSSKTGQMESGLLTLLSTSTEYLSAASVQRAQLRSEEVMVLLKQSTERLNAIISIANGQDDSGILLEVSELITQIEELIIGSQGILTTKIIELEAKHAAEMFLEESDKKIEEATKELNVLNTLADKKAISVKQTVTNQITSSTFTVIGVIVFSLIIAAVIGYYSVRAITVPLAKVNKLLNIASSGDLTHRLDDSSKDEFGKLASNCNKLIDNLKDLIETINQRAEQLAAASGQTSKITAQTTFSIEDQKQQISQIATATTQMHTTSDMVLTHANDTLQQIKYADVEAEKVKVISATNKSTIEVLAKDVQQAAQVINKLHQDSTSISGILDVIRGVSEQTNLLALNAAIEAARAGEQGRGFAVVADEVRTLASRTQKSTEEINGMIEVLQAGAEKAVAVMNQGNEQAVVCVEQTEKASEALELITDAVHKAYEVSTRIEQAAREQHTVSAQISERLENIVDIAEETTTGAQQTSDSSAEVAMLAEELQESIGRFKV